MLLLAVSVWLLGCSDEYMDRIRCEGQKEVSKKSTLQTFDDASITQDDINAGEIARVKRFSCRAMSTASRPHDEAVIELLREDPAFADEYLTACTEGIDEPGGREALLMALRQVAEAQGMAAVAERAGMQREGLYRALSPKGNPTLKTLLAVLSGAGLRLAVTRSEGTPHAA